MPRGCSPHARTRPANVVVMCTWTIGLAITSQLARATSVTWPSSCGTGRVGRNWTPATRGDAEIAVDVDGRVLGARLFGPEHVGRVAMGRHGMTSSGGVELDDPSHGRLTAGIGSSAPKGNRAVPGGPPPTIARSMARVVFRFELRCS